VDERLAADEADAAHAARAELVDGALPLVERQLVPVLTRDVAVLAAEIAAVGQRQGHLERALAPQEAPRAQLQNGNALAREARGALGHHVDRDPSEGSAGCAHGATLV